MNLKAIIHEAEEGGCMTQGETIEEITRNLREAVDGWLSVETPEGELASSDRVIEFAV
jgi:predicted RNase H-like HicB family nuclease